MRPIPAWVDGLLRAAVRLYPRRFREEFGDALLDAWRDQYRCGRRDLAQRLLQVVDTGRDLASSIVAEHQRDPRAAGHARLPLLVAMCLALIALIGQRTLVPALVDGVERSQHAWWNYRIERYPRAILAYYGTIADGLLATDDPRARVAGALLSSSLELPDADAATIDRHRRRRIALETAIGDAPGDPVVLFGVASSCELIELTRGDTASCPAPERRAAAIALLLQIEPDNGANWMLAADAAAARGDRESVHAALARVAAASTYDNHYRDYNARVVAAALARPPQSGLWDHWVAGLVPDATWVWGPYSQWSLEGERSCPMSRRLTLDPAACLGARESVRTASDSLRARTIAANYLVRHRGLPADRSAADTLGTISHRLSVRLKTMAPVDLATAARRIEREGDAPMLEWLSDGR